MVTANRGPSIRTEDPILKFIEHAPISIVVVDSQFRVHGYNQRAAAMFAEPLPAPGLNFAAVVMQRWSEPLASEVIARFRRTLATGESYVAPISTTRIDDQKQAAYEWQVQRVVLADGSFGVACYTQDLALVREAKEVVAEAARRNAFLLELNDRLRPLSEPRAIMTAAAEVLARALDLADAGYAEVEADGDTSLVGGQHTDGRLPTIRGTYRISDFGEGFGRTLRAGDDVVSEDVPADPRGPAGGSEATRTLRVRAAFATPLLKDGQLIAYFYTAHHEPRRWSAWERELMHDVAERTWAAVARARAENEVRDRERQVETLLDHAPLAVLLVDDEFRIRHANPLARAALGDVPELIGRELEALGRMSRSPEYAREIVRRCRHTLNTGESFESRETIGRASGDGSPTYYEWRSDRISLPEGRSGVVCYFRDITAAKQARELTVATEARYRALFESIDEAVAILDLRFDPDGRASDIYVVETNPALQTQTGMASIAGRCVRDLYPAFEQRWLDTFAEVAETGVSKRIEGFSQVAGRWFDVHVSRVGAAPSHRIAIVCSDVSQRIRASIALSTSEERNAYLLQLSDALRPLADPAEIQRVACRVLGERLGVSRALYGEVERSPDSDYYTIRQCYCAPAFFGIEGFFRGADFGSPLMEELRAGHTIAVDDVDAHPAIREAERAAHRSTGVRAYIGVPLVKDGRPIAFITVHQDVPRSWTPQEIALVEATGERTWAEAERGRAESVLRETEARLQLALDASSMGTLVYDVATDRGVADAQAAKLFGTVPGEALRLGPTLEKFVHPEDRERYLVALRALIDPADSRAMREDIRFLMPDGSIRWMEARGILLRGEATRSPKLVGTIADITERKLTEQALRESEERLRESDRRKDEFIAILAHELRNPLAPIRTGLALIKLAGDDLHAIEDVRAMMERQLTHMVRLIDDLLDVSRISSGKIQLRREPTPLAAIVQTVLDANRAALAERDIALRVELPKSRAMLDVDPTRFVQILSNVLHNAVKFTEARGRIAIVGSIEATAAGQRELVLSVTDSGTGISPELLTRVFDLFTQGNDSSRQNTGLGIGLALAKRLVEMHGGSIAAASKGWGHGSTFTIRLPLMAAATERPAAGSGQAGDKVACRVVVIDDNVDAANSLELFVVALGGDCRVAYDGERGLAVIHEFAPQLVLLDIGMPRVDGYETCRRIRELLGSDVTIVAITGWGQEHDKLVAAKSGFDAHLTKPVDPAVLKRFMTSESWSSDRAVERSN